MKSSILQILKKGIALFVLRISEKEVKNQLEYRFEAPVREKLLYPNTLGNDCYEYAVCPRCKISLERDYVEYCDRCGQHLSWDSYDDCEVIVKKCS